MVDENKTIVEDQPKNSWFWIKDTTGNSSATLSFVTVAFVVVTTSYIASMFMKVGPITFREFNPAGCAAFLTPLVSLYAARRYTDRNL